MQNRIKKTKNQPLNLVKGNEAIAMGAIDAGCRFYFGYPITPQNEIIEFMAANMAKAGGRFIQSESELAAINMVMGAGAAGGRVMTSSSGLGLSLMQEGISYMAGMRIPGLIVNVVRGGPGLGNISAAQSDYFQATRGGGHGDYRTPVFAPASVQETYLIPFTAFEWAEKYRTPVIVLSDAILGQMAEPMARLKSKDRVENPPKAWALTGCKKRSPNVLKSLYLGKGELEKRNQILFDTYKEMAENVLYEEVEIKDAEIIMVAYGAVSRICRNALRILRDEHGIKVGLMRPITLYPYPSEVIAGYAKKKKVKKILVSEMSTGQMWDDVRLANKGRLPLEFYGRTGGEVPLVKDVVDWVLTGEVKNGFYQTD